MNDNVAHALPTAKARPSEAAMAALADGFHRYLDHRQAAIPNLDPAAIRLVVTALRLAAAMPSLEDLYRSMEAAARPGGADVFDLREEGRRSACEDVANRLRPLVSGQQAGKSADREAV